MSKGKFEVFVSSRNSQYYLRLKAANGEIILGSEGYVSKQGCLNGVASVRTNAPFDSRYERKDGYLNYTFNLKSSNGEVIGRSEHYTSLVSRENKVTAVKNYSKDT